MVRTITVVFVCLAVSMQATATSRSILGLVTKVTEGRKGQVYVKVLWDSYCRDYGETMGLRLNKRWPGCKFRLDGKDTPADEAVKVGRLLWCHLNRQMLRVVECHTLSDDQLKQCRPAGKGALMVDLSRGIAWMHERKGKMQRRSTNLALGIVLANDSPRAVTAGGSGFNRVGFRIDRQQLKLDGDRVVGSVTLTIPFKPEKRKPTPAPLTANYTIDVPAAGGDGKFSGTCGDLEVESTATAVAIKQEVPPRCNLWISIDSQAEQIALPVVDGVPQQENAVKLHSKGYIKASASSVTGKVTAEGLLLQVKIGEEHYVLQGAVCGDRVMGTVTHGDHAEVFYGGILPTALVPNGRIGHRDDDIPPRK